ncbi:MAG: hypothetical protein QXY84_02830 [Candidatus Caldarchaeum sp.]
MQIYTVMKLKIAVVNSLTFGAYTDVFTCLNRLGEVTRLNVPRDIRGSELAAVLAGYHVAVVSTNPRYDREFFEKTLILCCWCGTASEWITSIRKQPRSME